MGYMCVYIVRVCMCADTYVHIYADMCICWYLRVSMCVYIFCLCILLATGTVPLKPILYMQKCIIFSHDNRVFAFYNDPDCAFCHPASCGNMHIFAWWDKKDLLLLLLLCTCPNHFKLASLSFSPSLPVCVVPLILSIYDTLKENISIFSSATSSSAS